MLEVIGAGFGRNGTDSLRKALEHLGLGPCHHMAEVIQSPMQLALWRAVEDGRQTALKEALAGFRSQVDWPGAAYWEKLIRLYPEAKVILSVRDPDDWFDSIQATIVPFIEKMSAQSEDLHLRELAQWSGRVILRDVFGNQLNDRSHAKAVYRAHTQRLVETVPADRLLVFEVADGWAPLCAFLGVASPTELFPNSNSTADFQDSNKV